ncbi:MAG: RNA polymerase sigma-70 factor [Actinomycetota bacterium]
MGDPAVFAGLRSLLFSIAYRMLGSVTDAEDMVQEAFLRWDRVPDAEVVSPKAYLSSVVTRLCIDHLRSARVARETYVGPWLPDPILTAVADPDGGGEDRALLADSLSMAFLVLLESLSPVERAVFLLRETFGYDYAEIASIVGRSEANCRQITVRARKQLEARRPRFAASPAMRERITGKFIHAAETGDLAELLDLLSDDIVLWSDGGGKVRAARHPVVGPVRVARLLLGLTRRYAGLLVPTPAEINGQPGLLLAVAGARIGALVLDITDDDREGGPISGIRIVVNPEKLAGIAGGTG